MYKLLTMADCEAYLKAFSLFALLISTLYCKEYLLELSDFKELDDKISSFLKNPSKVGWEDNLLDIEFYDNSMKDMIQTLNNTFDGLTSIYFRKAEQFVKNGKPIFIDTDVVEYEVQPLINVTDDQLQRLYWQRVYCEKDWELLVDMITLKKQVEIILPE